MLRTLLAGQDGPRTSALPAGEFLHPLPLAALLLLVANDWWLKPSSWAPGALTGKLSDFAGLLFFPLLLTALLDCCLLAVARAGVRVDFSLRPYKLLASLLLSAAVFAALKVSPQANEMAVSIARSLGLNTQIVRDPTDLVALSILWLPYQLGRGEIARCPLGRIEVVRRAGTGADVSHALRDLQWAGAEPENVAQLIEALTAFVTSDSEQDARRLEVCLATLRDLSPPPA